MPVEVVGVKDVLNGLSFIDEDLRVRISTAIDPLMRAVAEKAKGFVPSNEQVLSGWSKPLSSIDTINYEKKAFPKYDSSIVKAGIGYNPGKNKILQNGWQVSQYVYNVSRAGSIYETAGRLNPQGRAPFTFKHEGSGTYVRKSARSKALDFYDSNNPFASQQFIGALEPVTKPKRVPGVRGASGRKMQGRLIFKAWAQDNMKVYEAILKAIDKTAVEFTRKTEIKKVA
jgi:hypothetical protein